MKKNQNYEKTKENQEIISSHYVKAYFTLFIFLCFGINIEHSNDTFFTFSLFDLHWQSKSKKVCKYNAVLLMLSHRLISLQSPGFSNLIIYKNGWITTWSDIQPDIFPTPNQLNSTQPDSELKSR